MIKIFVVLALAFQATLQDGCNLNMFGVYHSVVFNTNFEMIYPPPENAPGDRNITIPIGETIIISCNGGDFDGSYETTKTITATCDQDSQFEVQDNILDFDSLNCINIGHHVVERATNIECAPNSVFIEVGFQVGLNIKFVPQVRYCFDTKNLNTVYAGLNLTKSIGSIRSYLMTGYAVDSVYTDVDFDSLYNVTNQQTFVNNLLGLPEDSVKYIDPATCESNPGFCFSMRPLAFRGTFVYIPQQEATFRYINIVPQWSFLDDNLEALEWDVINYVKKNKLDLEVYTGTYGVATLPHSTSGESIELFLLANENENGIPVPLIFWKLIYDQLNKEAAILLMVNDPYQEDVNKNVICEDISDNFDWLTWDKSNVTKGYSYACSYEDAKSKISYLPDLEVEGVFGVTKY